MRFWRLDQLGGIVAMFCAIALLSLGHRPPLRLSSLNGQVVAEGTDLPLGGAIVTINSDGLKASRSQVTDSQGRFSFPGLVAGRFTLTATKASYIAMAYGAERAGRAGITLAVAEGQSLSDLVIRLPKGAVLTGTVRDASGSGIAGVSIWALELRAGDVRAAQVGSATTDDRGVYRIFGLAAGSYLVAAAPVRVASGAMAIPSTEENDRRFAELLRPTPPRTPVRAAQPSLPVSYVMAVTFFPGTPAPGDAQPIALASGEERTADFQLAPIQAGSITGSATAVDGAAVQALTVAFDAIGPALPATVWRATLNLRSAAPDGSFRFAGVPPGRYVVSARAERASGTRVASRQLFWAAAEVVSATGDVGPVRLTLKPAVTLAGSLVFEGTMLPLPRDLSQVRVLLEASPDRVRDPGASSSLRSTVPVVATAKEDRSFAIANVLPGKYTISATGVGQWWLRSVVVAGQDVLDTGFEAGDVNVEGAVLKFSDRPAELAGTVVPTQGAAASDFGIVVFTTDRSLWRAGARRVRLTRPASDGQFLFGNLPGGDYYLAAVSDIDSSDLGDPEFLARLVPASLTVSLTEGERRKQDLRVGR